ncbi:hypothetical protein C7974DRAFT_232635 [Boeremia exigua]|uniref:uncharacterized protein n=1 Tax=Boeremia exigua TaxID=749465 RepID=UPI001E8E58C3|nr:uncharacterized protein C7974DRAFT_232635 [Boeremia exigua]KAH6620391.1 hypothetical protein C7974DRAFT_232635 [Boeremia exigua]
MRPSSIWPPFPPDPHCLPASHFARVARPSGEARPLPMACSPNSSLCPAVSSPLVPFLLLRPGSENRLSRLKQAHAFCLRLSASCYSTAIGSGLRFSETLCALVKSLKSRRVHPPADISISSCQEQIAYPSASPAHTSDSSGIRRVAPSLADKAPQTHI